MVELSVVILSFNTHELLGRCIAHAETAVRGRNAEIIVVDNGSTDGTLDDLRQLGSRVRLIQADRNLGYAGGNNLGIASATGECILLINSDAFVTRAAVDQALDLFTHQPRLGICGVRIVNPDGSLQAGPGRFPTLWDDVATSLGIDQLRGSPGHVSDRAPRPVDWIHGACLFVRRATIDQIGDLDTSFFMYSEEVEWCHRCWSAGWQVWYLPAAPVVHLGGASSENDDIGRRTALYQSRLKLRRRVSGRFAAGLLWLAMVLGLTGRIVVRSMLQLLSRRRVGRQSPRSDWQLLIAMSRAHPLSFNGPA